MQQQIQRATRVLERVWVYVCECACEWEWEWERQGETGRETERAVSPGSAILTICEGLEAHLAAVFAKASHSPSPHLYHVHCTRPEALHACCVSLASQDGGVNLCVVLQGSSEGSGLEMIYREDVGGKVLNLTVQFLKTHSKILCYS